MPVEVGFAGLQSGRLTARLCRGCRAAPGPQETTSEPASGLPLERRSSDWPLERRSADFVKAEAGHGRFLLDPLVANAARVRAAGPGARARARARARVAMTDGGCGRFSERHYRLLASALHPFSPFATRFLYKCIATYIATATAPAVINTYSPLQCCIFINDRRSPAVARCAQQKTSCRARVANGVLELGALSGRR